MGLHQLGLKPLKITDRPIIDSILTSRETMLSAYAFAAHYIWRDIFHFYWGIIDDHLCLFAQYDDYIYMPIPPVPCNISSFQNLNRIISTAFSIMEQLNKNKAVSRIENIDEAEKKAFVSLGYDIRPGEPEYVYRREDLANLRGNLFKSKRAMYNHFVKQYQYGYEPFESVHVSDCMQLFREWKRERCKKIKDPLYQALIEDSHFAHSQVVKHYRTLKLTGRVVRIRKRVEGYIFGFGRRNVFYILLEVTNPDIRGLAQFIFREFCREMGEYAYINTLGDSGLENLRMVKQSYRPCKIVPSHIAYLPD